jgi:hypothetical protein
MNKINVLSIASLPKGSIVMWFIHFFLDIVKQAFIDYSLNKYLK